MRLAEQIKEYVKCPQTGSHHYGRWGLALSSADRMLVDRLCDQCMIFEDAADKFHKENIDLKEENAQLKEEIEILHTALELADRQLYGMSSDDLIEQAKEELKDE